VVAAIGYGVPNIYIYIYTSVAIYVQLIMQFKSSNVTLMISWSKFGQKWREKRIRRQMLRALYEECFPIYLMQTHVNRRNIKVKRSWDMRSLMSGVQVWAPEQIFLEVKLSTPTSMHWNAIFWRTYFVYGTWILITLYSLPLKRES